MSWQTSNCRIGHCLPGRSTSSFMKTSSQKFGSLVQFCLFSTFLLCLFAAANADHTTNSTQSPPPPPLHHPYTQPYHQPSPGTRASNATFPGVNVTIVNITIYDKHAGWLDRSTDVYFKCEGEAKQFIPEIKDVGPVYRFHGREPFQPLTHLQHGQCKKCGLYEKDTWTSDDTFAEWSLCTANFTTSLGIFYVSFPGQFLALLHCPLCNIDPKRTQSTPKEEDSTVSVLFILLIIFSSFSLIVGVGLAFLWARKRHFDKVHREETAKFMVLSDDDDDDVLELQTGNNRL